MKKILLAAFAILSLVCQAQNPAALRLSKAKALVRKELKGSLHDYASYEPVRWSSLDSVFSSVEDDPRICRLMDDLMEKHSKLPGDPSNIGLFMDMSGVEKQWKDALDNSKNEDLSTDFQLKCLNNWIAISDFNVAQKKAKEAIDAFESRFIGWSISHRFRAKNPLGAKVITEWVFRFDPDVKVIDSIIKE